MPALLARRGVHPLRVQLVVHRVGADLPGVQRLPHRAEALVVLIAALAAWPVACGKRGRLIQEEQLGVAPGLHERRPPAALELQAARDPAAHAPAAADLALGVVDDPAVGVDQTARGVGEDLLLRGGAVAQGHRVHASPGGPLPGPGRAPAPGPWSPRYAPRVVAAPAPRAGRR